MKKIKHTFRLTDLVHISKLPAGMSKFHEGSDAIVVGRNEDSDQYILHVKHVGELSWYEGKSLTLISHNNGELLDQWEAGDYGRDKKKKRKIPKELRNFTAILPVTCNADCSFCPEKEMEQKANQKEWQDGLIAQIKRMYKKTKFDHVSISGGEPTLRTKFLFETIDRIQKETPIKKVGLTSNGQFLEKPNSTFDFLDRNTTPEMTSKLSHLNISMHSFNRERANKIMGVNYKQTLEDLVRFRRQLGRDVSFHINFVINDQTGSITEEFKAAANFMRANPFIDVVFRVDYNDVELSKALRDYAMEYEEYNTAVRTSKRKLKLLAPRAPHIVQKFDRFFGGQNLDDVESAWTTGCPSCFTHASNPVNNSRAYLKASSYEPNEDEAEYTELVYHMDGALYWDWTRNDPVPLPRSKRFDFEMKEERADKPMPRLKSAPKAKTVKKAKTTKKETPTTSSGSCHYSAPCSYSQGTGGSCSFRSGGCNY
ncbi:hypothetical protein pEaSNUABM35_00272 [Erwinia phage pEa_SNUABM_35]|uniref:Radical SAM core domain-containing protein n=1 Tax=Erwinia phage pEa_SNUABM_35 TaxID=2869557 RepID=A0AAE8C288_9CAUD|nr:hypothetical protein MPK65_gp272 [Erwinia phage pEa_SNUABM_35]QZE60189.1 hypothetical protein pEaSNUABM35_00272 [Erwinia phage pEa_SNUABM_35]QZE60525.1 hypothetical protein pEaSNUABM36_00272 [Erwinia phage pEa_SNUABM_36]